MNSLPHEAQQGEHPHTRPSHGHHGSHHRPDAGTSHLDPPAADPSGAGAYPSTTVEPQDAESIEPPAATD